MHIFRLYSQRRYCALIGYLRRHVYTARLEGIPTTKGKPGVHLPNQYGDVDCLMEVRQYMDGLKQLSRGEPHLWEKEMAEVIRVKLEKYHVGRRTLQLLLTTAPTLTHARRFIEEHNIQDAPHVATFLMKLCIRTGAFKDFETMWEGLLEEDQPTAPVLNELCQYLARERQHTELAKLITRRQATYRHRVSADIMSLWVSSIDTYTDLNVTLNKIHNWRITGRSLAYALVEVSLRLLDSRCAVLIKWVLEGDFADPICPDFIKKDESAETKIETNEDAANAILADLREKAFRRKRRMNTWSGGWGGLVLFYCILGNEAAARREYRALERTGMELDFVCRKYLLRGAGIVLAKRRNAFWEAVADHANCNTLQNLHNQVRSGRYRYKPNPIRKSTTSSKDTQTPQTDSLSLRADAIPW